jgi:uncharacterized membrane protein YhaH (DUF805 family)
MLEEIAVQYVNQTEATLRALSYGLSIAGGIAAGILHKSDSELHRAPYFAWTGILFLITAASQLIWFGVIQAMSGGFLWVFVLVDVVIGLGFGYGYAVAAMARSRDAYGHGGKAFLAFIPIVNFLLFLTPSRNQDAANHKPTHPLLTGGLGVLAGFAMYFAGFAISTFIKMELDRMVVNSGKDPAIQSMSVDVMLRSQGIEETLRRIAVEVPRQRVDETTTLLRVEADRMTIRYIYEVSTVVDQLPGSVRVGLVQQNCGYDFLQKLMKADATIEHVYRQSDGSSIGVVTVSRQICGF